MLPPPPTITTTSVPEAVATLQRVEAQYGPQAQAAGQTALSFYSAHLTTFQVTSVILSTAFVAGVVYSIIKTGWLASRVDRIQDVIFKTDLSKKRTRAAWEDIEAHFFAGDDNDLKVAIIEADMLLDEALRSAGVAGAQLGDRLKRVKTSQLPNIDDVWQAHKIRNRIAHETEFVLKRDLAERALTVYEKAFRHLGILDPEKELLKDAKEENRSPQ